MHHDVASLIKIVCFVQQMTAKQQRRMFAHAGIVAAASAILEDLKLNGMLSRLMRNEDQRQADESQAQAEGNATQASSHAQAAGTVMQELLDKKVLPYPVHCICMHVAVQPMALYWPAPAK